MRLYTDNKDEVDVPDWADEYEVGDFIHYYNPHTFMVESSKIIGFSTRQKTPGLPVIRSPKGVAAKEAAVDEKHHQHENDLKQNAD